MDKKRRETRLWILLVHIHMYKTRIAPAQKLRRQEMRASQGDVKSQVNQRHSMGRSRNNGGRERARTPGSYPHSSRRTAPPRDPVGIVILSQAHSHL